MPKHIPALDGLRGVAVLMVILTHCASGWPTAMAVHPFGPLPGPSLVLPTWLGFVAGQAMHGVQLFFVVSAFTLTMRPIYRLDQIAPYALRRIARIGPAYWTAGLAYMLLAGFAPRLSAPHGITPVDIAIAGVFGSAWQAGAALAVVPGGWSVGCEASFYVALPLLLWIINGRVLRALLLTVVAVVIAQLRARSFMADADLAFDVYMSPIEQAPVFLCGITAALATYRSRPSRLGNAGLIFIALCAVAVTLFPPASLRLLTHLGTAALFAPLVALAARKPLLMLSSRMLRQIGKVSYSMYLIHFAVLAPSIWVAESVVPGNDWRTMAVHFVLCSAVTFALACASYSLVEAPAIQWAAAQTRTVRTSASVLSG